MQFLALLAALLLSLVGYSLGVVLRSGKAGARKPLALDILLVAVMWAGIIYARSHVAFSKWILLGIGIAAGFLLGWIVTAVKGYSEAESQSAVEPVHAKAPHAYKRFKAFREVSYKIGTFQSLIFFGLLYLVVFAPIALIVKLVSDPLKMKGLGRGSNWLPKADIAADIKLFKKQS